MKAFQWVGGALIPGLLLLVLASPASGQDNNQQQGMRHDRLEAAAASLNLNDQQKADVQKVFTSFDQKVDQVDKKLWTLNFQEHQAVMQVLTPEQRAKLPEVIKPIKEKELNKIGAKLGLNDDQKQRIEKICDQFEPKFQELVQQQGQAASQQFHQLRNQVFAAVRKELTTEQKAKLPGIFREEFQQWHNPAMQSQLLQEVSQRLDLRPEQKEQFQKILADFKTKIDQPVTQLRQFHQDERSAVEQVLTDQQRTRLREMLKAGGKD
jgi:hypothetical protein